MNRAININAIIKDVVVVLWAVLCVSLLIYFLSVVHTYKRATTVQTEVLQWSSDTARWGGGWAQ